MEEATYQEEYPRSERNRAENTGQGFLGGQRGALGQGCNVLHGYFSACKLSKREWRMVKDFGLQMRTLLAYDAEVLWGGWVEKDLGGQ